MFCTRVKEFLRKQNIPFSARRRGWPADAEECERRSRTVRDVPATEPNELENLNLNPELTSVGL